MAGPSTLDQLLTSTARRYPDATFLDAGGEHISYAEFEQRVARICSGLVDAGVEPGQPVAALLPAGREWIETFFAVARLGGVFLPLSPLLKASEVDRMLDDSEAVALIADADHAESVEAIWEERLTLRAVFCVGEAPGVSLEPFDCLLQAEPAEPAEKVQPDTTASLIYTAGMSRSPRGVLLSHASYDAASRGFAGAVGLGPNDRMLCTLPLAHASGHVMGPLAAMQAAATCVIPHAQPVQALARAIADAKITVLLAAPPLIERLTQADEVAPDALDGLRLAITTGAPIASETRRQFEERFDIPLVAAYGLTEACGVCTVEAVEARDLAPGSVGEPIDAQRLRVVDDDGVARRADAVGEVVIEGPNLMRGYLDDPQASRNISSDGWLQTGDLGYLDGDERLFLVGRTKELIVRGDQHIYPREIEETLLRHPAVDEAAVIGLDDPKQGEEVVLFLVLAAGHSFPSDEIFSYCREHLADYKCPGIVEYRDALPMTATGRVRKSFLAQSYASLQSGA